MARKSRKNITDRQIEILNIAQYIRTAEYVRLSVEDNDNKGNSIENQKLILDDYIAHNSDMRLVDVYIDNGATGTNFQRPEFQRMIKDSYKHAFDCIIVWKLDRRQRKLRVDEDMLVYSVYFAYGYVYENLYEYGCLV